MKTKRPSMQTTIFDVLKLLAKRSTCDRMKVASVAVKDGRIVSTGWNGVPSGNDHCCDIFSHDEDSYFVDGTKVSKDVYLNMHHQFSEDHEIHSEINLITTAAKNGIKLDGCQLYITISPCKNCAKAIQQCGFTDVFFEDYYDRDLKGDSIAYLKNNKKLKVWKFNREQDICEELK